MVDISKYKGKGPADIFALGGTGPEAKAAWLAQDASREGKDFGDVSRGFRETGRASTTGQETQKFQDWTTGSSGYTDIYRKGKAGEISGPEHHLGKSGDVDIHGYPDDWEIRSTDEGTYITPATGSWAGKEYFKPHDTSGGGGDSPAPTTGGGTVVTGVQPFALSTLTDEMDLSNAIAGLLDQNSPLFKAAGNAAMQRMAKRGLGIVNSSIAFGEVERAILDVAMPIAKAEVDNLIANLNKRTEWTNAERKQANDYVFGKMLKEIDNAAAYELAQMKEEFGLDRARYGGLADVMAADKTKPDYWDKYMNLVRGS